MDASGAAIQQAYAAWVQAVGSLVAIAVAIYVPYQQRRQDMRQREFRYWSERADVERRILLVAGDLAQFFQRLVENSRPGDNATTLCSYDPVLHEELWNRISMLEARDIGDSGHDRVAVMRSILKRLRSLFRDQSLAIKPGSPFSRELAEGPIGQDMSVCVSETTDLLEVARQHVMRYGGDK